MSAALKARVKQLEKRRGADRPRMFLHYRRGVDPVPVVPPGANVTIVEECVVTVDADGRLVFGDPETGEPTDELVPDGFLDRDDLVRG